MACRDGLGIEKAVLSNTALPPAANRKPQWAVTINIFSARFRPLRWIEPADKQTPPSGTTKHIEESIPQRHMPMEMRWEKIERGQGRILGCKSGIFEKNRVRAISDGFLAEMGFGTWRIRIRNPFYMQIALRTPVIEAEIRKLEKSRFSWFGARREPLLVEKWTLSLCCAQCFKEIWLVETA